MAAFLLATAFAVAPAPAAIAAPAPGDIRMCDDLVVAAKKDPSLARAVRDVNKALTGKEATRAALVKALDTTGAAKNNPTLAIYTQHAANSIPDASRSGLADTQTTYAALGLCVREAWGPGKVVWTWGCPSCSPYDWSYLPEGSSSLNWATAPDDNTDGIYKRVWAPCIALKIPDSATVTVYTDGSFYVCENAFMAGLGHVVKWVNPCSGDENSWPNDGL